MFLSLQQAALGYGNTSILRNINMEAGPGECIGLIGPNGSGKTTLLRSLAGIQPLLSGTLYLQDRPLKTYTRKELARQLAYLPQEQPLPFAYTAGEIVLTGRYPHLSWYAGEGGKERQLAIKALSVLGLEHEAETPVDCLSGGQRQRVFLARTLLQDSQFFLLDEPASGLDFVYEERAFQLCRQLTDLGRSVIVSVHDLSLAARFCHRLLLLGRHTLLAQGSPGQVLTAANLSRAYETACQVTGTGTLFRLQLQEEPERLHRQQQLLKEILQEA